MTDVTSQHKPHDVIKCIEDKMEANINTFNSPEAPVIFYREEAQALQSIIGKLDHERKRLLVALEYLYNALPEGTSTDAGADESALTWASDVLQDFRQEIHNMADGTEQDSGNYG